MQIFDGTCQHYVDWLAEIRPSFSPPRRDLNSTNDTSAVAFYTDQLDNLNNNFKKLLDMLSQRLQLAVEVSGADGLVSYISF